MPENPTAQNPPAQQPQTQQPAAEQNEPKQPTLQEREKQMQEAMAEFEQSLNSIEQDFANACVEMCNADPKMDELYFDNRLDFFKKILEFQNQFTDERINKPRANLEQMQSDITLEQNMQALDNAKEAFEKAHPEISVQELMQFYMQLPEQARAQLEQITDPMQFFETLLDIYNQAKNPKEQEKEQEPASDPAQEPSDNLPQQASGVSANISANEPDIELPMRRY